MTVELKVSEEFRQVLPALSDDELKTLEENIKSDGKITDPILYWHDKVSGVNWIVDGMHRHTIAVKNGLEYKAEPMDFADKNAVIDWIILHQIGRRNITEKAMAQYRGRVYKTIIDGKSQVDINDFVKATGVSTVTLELDQQFAESLSRLPEKMQRKIIAEEIKISKRDIVDLVNIDPTVAVKSIESADEHNIPIRQIVDSEKTRVSMCAILGDEHEWVSDGHGNQFCAKCNADLPSPKNLSSLPADKIECKTLVGTIDSVRKRIDRVKDRFLVEDARWKLILDKLDEARIALAAMIRLEWD